MYTRKALVLRVIQEYDVECAVGDHMNAKAQPLQSGGEFNWKSHMAFQCHYHLDYDPDWQWDKSPAIRLEPLMVPLSQTSHQRHIESLLC